MTPAIPTFSVDLLVIFGGPDPFVGQIGFTMLRGI